MPNSIIAEGRTTNEAIENGLKELNAKKEDVIINVIGNEEKSPPRALLFQRIFVILQPKMYGEIIYKQKYNIKRKAKCLQFNS